MRYSICGASLRASCVIAVLCLVPAPAVQAESPLAGLNDDPSARLLFAIDPFEEPIGYLMLEGNAKEMILRRFGEPEDVHESIVPTRFPGETYASYSYRFEDVSFVVNEWPDRKWSWIERIEIAGNSQKLKFDVRIGSEREQVIAVFSPTERYKDANPMAVGAHVFEQRSHVGEDGSTPDEPGTTYGILFEFDEGDRVSKISVTATESS